MRNLILGTALVAVTFMPIMARADDSAEKVALAKEYSQLVPVDSEIATTIEQLALQVPVAQRVQFKAILAQTIKPEKLKAASELALIDIFTEDELEALIEFYKTPEGQAIKTKMPEYQNRLQPVLSAMIQEAATSLQNQMQQGQ